MRTCPKCKQEKSLEDFHRSRRARSGRQTYCKTCQNGNNRKYGPARRGRRRFESIKYRYRMSEADVLALVTAQGGVCATGCGAAIHDGFHVDHSHVCCPNPRGQTCGKCVRGLLCRGCNLALGHAAESPARLRAIADYIERTSA